MLLDAWTLLRLTCMLAPALLNDVSPGQKLWAFQAPEDSLCDPLFPIGCCRCCWLHQTLQMMTSQQPWSSHHLNGQTGPHFLWSKKGKDGLVLTSVYSSGLVSREVFIFFPDRCLTFSSGRLSVPFSPVLPSSAGGVRPGGGEGWGLVAALRASIQAAGTEPDPQEETWNIA